MSDDAYGLPVSTADPEALAFYDRAVRSLQAWQADALELFRAAAERGVAVAQNRLARCYAHGAGVEASPVEAAKWHLIAKAAGQADDSLDKIVAKLSKADRAKAQKAADEWRDRTQVGIE